MSKKVLTRKTDDKGRVTLTKDFANCLVTVEVHGEELRIRKATGARPRKYSFKELMAGVTPENIHAEIKTGPPVGREAL
jgi:antitoxin component of MazEF toxin-antitoxin module